MAISTEGGLSGPRPKCSTLMNSLNPLSSPFYIWGRVRQGVLK